MSQSLPTISQSPVWHPFTQHGRGEPIPLVKSASGALLHLADGTSVIDAISSWWVTTHGHCNPRIMAAIAEQAGKLDQLIFAGWTHEPAEEVAAGLRALMPDSLTRVFFSDSGSTCVEVALKMALGYWHWNGENRSRIVVLENSYHGDTIGTMSVGERGVFNRPYEPLLFDVARIPFPRAGAEEATLDALEALCKLGDTAALIVEPLVLGAGGMLFYTPEVLARMRAICSAHGVLLIADEVMTGWGRTGTLLACEQAGIEPDILCLSKGLTGGAVPLAVTMATEAIFEAHLHAQDRSRAFYHSSSYTANALSCAAAAANIAIWREEPVRERIKTLSEKQADWLDKLGQVYHFNNARTCGTIAALDIKVNDEAGYLNDVSPHLQAFFRERNVLLRPLGNTIYVMPPYCITDDELAQVWDAIGEAVLAF